MKTTINLLGMIMGAFGFIWWTGQTEKAGLALLLVAGFTYVAGIIRDTQRRNTTKKPFNILTKILQREIEKELKTTGK